MTFEVLRHISAVLRYSAHRAERERDDAAVQLALTQESLPLPRGMELEWLGTAGYRISYQGHAIYIDPYFSRIPMRAMFSSGPALPNHAVIESILGGRNDTVEGILVGHCHFDHAIDVPELTRRFGTTAYGSHSLERLMHLHGLSDRSVSVEPHRPYELGPFTVRFVPSQHSKLILGLAVPSQGELSCEHLDALTPGAYRCGQVWGIHIEVAGISFYHQGSANLLDDQIRARGVDIFLAGVSGRRFTPDYWQRILGCLQPNYVVASHFDDFFRPLGDGLGYSLNVNLAALPDEIADVSREFKLASLEPLKPVRGG